MKRDWNGALISSRRIKSCHQDDAEVRLKQSGSVGTHEHIWIIIDGECLDAMGEHLPPMAHLSLRAARSLRDQLTELIDALEGRR